MKPVPGFPGAHYCYDPVDLSKGTHGYPNRDLVFAYDVNDFLAVKNGTRKPWDVRPYATWTFTVPFQQRLVSGVDLGIYEILGAAYDPGEVVAGSRTRPARIFLSAGRSDGAAPLIHVFQLP